MTDETFCCETFAAQINYRCPQHDAEGVRCPDVVLYRTLQFCPWCGTKVQDEREDDEVGHVDEVRPAGSRLATGPEFKSNMEGTDRVQEIADSVLARTGSWWARKVILDLENQLGRPRVEGVRGVPQCGRPNVRRPVGRIGASQAFP